MSASIHRIDADLLTVHLGPTGAARVRSTVPFAIGASRYSEGWNHLVTAGHARGSVRVWALGGREGSIEVTPKK